MAKQRGRASLLFLCFLIAAVATLTIRQGVLPSRYLPVFAIDLTQSSPWFVDWRLAALRHDPATCKAVLTSPAIDADPVADRTIENGCGWENAFRVNSAGGARIPIDKLSCPAAAALTLWLAHHVQPAAREHLGQTVASVRHFGGYSCRNIVGSRYFAAFRSEHATANAIDIAGFTLANGRTVSVQQHWKGTGPEAAFLRQIHKAACQYFRVAIGPNYNAAHHDHFHFDRGAGWSCK